MEIISFTPTGQTQSFTAAASAPTAVQATSTAGNQFRIINSGSVVVFLGVGATAAAATTNATSSFPSLAIPLLPGTDEILTFAINSWFTGLASSSTAVIYITPGIGV